MKFYEYIMNGFQISEGQILCQNSKGNYSKSVNQKLWFLKSARLAILIDKCMKI